MVPYWLIVITGREWNPAHTDDGEPERAARTQAKYTDQHQLLLPRYHIHKTGIKCICIFSQCITKIKLNIGNQIVPQAP